MELLFVVFLLVLANHSDFWAIIRAFGFFVYICRPS